MKCPEGLGLSEGRVQNTIKKRKAGNKPVDATGSAVVKDKPKRADLQKFLAGLPTPSDLFFQIKIYLISVEDTTAGSTQLES